MTQETFPSSDADGPEGTYGEPAMPVDPGAEPVDGVPPDIADAVRLVENRYGAPGLEQLIEAAQRELSAARAALAELGGTDG